jgi:hypothetical protein
MLCFQPAFDNSNYKFYQGDMALNCGNKNNEFSMGLALIIFIFYGIFFSIVTLLKLKIN